MSMSISLSCFEALRRASAEIDVAILVVWRKVMGAIAGIVVANGLMEIQVRENEMLEIARVGNQVYDASLRITDVLRAAGRGCGSLAWAQAWR